MLTARARIRRLSSPASWQDRARVLATTRGYRRVLAVTDDLDDTGTLVAAGFRSAVAIAQLRADEVAARTGLAPDVAARTWDRAREIAAGVSAHLGTVLDVVNGGFGGRARGRSCPLLTDLLGRAAGR